MCIKNLILSDVSAHGKIVCIRQKNKGKLRCLNCFRSSCVDEPSLSGKVLLSMSINLSKTLSNVNVNMFQNCLALRDEKRVDIEWLNLLP